MSRHHYTTGFIRDAVLNELCDHGHAVLTMETIARRSFSSIGSVYSRYPNKIAAMDDVLTNVVLPRLESAPYPPGETVLARFLSDADTARCMTALVEMALCSRHCDDLSSAARALVSLTRTRIMETHGDDPATDGLRWLVGSVLVGHVVLDSVGCAVPSIDNHLATLVSLATCTSEAHDRTTARPASMPVPSSPTPSSSDDVAMSLAAATTEELAEAGMSGANVRRIASRVGVTTGAVYRRYTSKGELVRDALVRELGPHRYSWTDDFIDAVTSPQAGRSPGDVLADQIFALLNDRTKMLSTLEMIHSARTDAKVRETLVAQLENAAATRAQLFQAFADAEERTPAVSPQLMGWVIQMAPTGARVLSALGDAPNEQHVRLALRNVMNAALS